MFWTAFSSVDTHNKSKLPGQFLEILSPVTIVSENSQVQSWPNQSSEVKHDPDKPIIHFFLVLLEIYFKLGKDYGFCKLTRKSGTCFFKQFLVCLPFSKGDSLSEKSWDLIQRKNDPLTHLCQVDYQAFL